MYPITKPIDITPLYITHSLLDICLTQALVRDAASEFEVIEANSEQVDHFDAEFKIAQTYEQFVRLAWIIDTNNDLHISKKELRTIDLNKDGSLGDDEVAILFMNFSIDMYAIGTSVAPEQIFVTGARAEAFLTYFSANAGRLGLAFDQTALYVFTRQLLAQ